jgi:dihydroorotate dehydrogenase (fumarate)
MVDLTTNYVGLTAGKPHGAVSVAIEQGRTDSAKRLEDAGASAVVMYSLFEEKIEAEEHQIDRFFLSASDRA